ncbi:glycosyl transferase 2 family protein [Synechococcus sp. A18-25c]|uniref:glycosyltransferase n=1 Tax=Synechococcus sp. A18-25c TaxID=1866938 RepID=UPI001646D795|nr:glycosyltransferase [Synechococcus sp. A18-25c]QNJ18462.1 glycosyl transferase 2 family protein [Synechococcus sp. A18-25c]
MRLSILVVSRTAGLVSTMLSSLNEALHVPSEEVEILCSWNGVTENEAQIQNESRYEFLVANRTPYHFASNMNELADKANGEVLLLINDDVVLDHNSIDAALDCHDEQPNTGLVGARLRDHNGWLTHAGILFDQRHSPYHQFDRLIGSEHHAVLGRPRAVPAATGAAMLIRRDHFQSLRFSTDYRVCGEDVELCLALRGQLNLNVIYCPLFSGEHSGEATRGNDQDQRGNSEDLTRMRALHERFLNTASPNQLRVELAASVAEADALRSLETHRRQEGQEISQLLAELKKIDQKKEAEKLTVNPAIQTELTHLREQTHALQLSRLKLEQKLKRANQGY